MDTALQVSTYGKLSLKQVVVEILIPECHPISRLRIIQQLTKRQLKQFQSDSLQVYVLTNLPRLSLIATPKNQDKVYLFADDVDVADACAQQFYSDAVARLQTLEPRSAMSTSPSMRPSDPEPSQSYHVVSYVARTNASPAGTASVVDLMELESRIMAKCDPSACAIFEPEEYPGLVWLDIGDSNEMVPDPMADLGSQIECELRTIVFPSGSVVVHGTNLERMEEATRKKLPLIQKCMRGVPDSIADSFNSRSGNA